MCENLPPEQCLVTRVKSIGSARNSSNFYALTYRQTGNEENTSAKRRTQSCWVLTDAHSLSGMGRCSKIDVCARLTLNDVQRCGAQQASTMNAGVATAQRAKGTGPSARGQRLVGNERQRCLPCKTGRARERCKERLRGRPINDPRLMQRGAVASTLNLDDGAFDGHAERRRRHQMAGFPQSQGSANPANRGGRSHKVYPRSARMLRTRVPVL